MTLLQDLDTPRADADRRARADFRRGALVAAGALVVAWPLGLVYLGWMLVGLVAALGCLRLRATSAPRATAAWWLLLLAVLVSALQVETAGRAAAFAYRGLLLLSASAVCVYLYSARSRVSFDGVLGAVAGVHAVVVLSGVAGLLFPGLGGESLLLRLLPDLGQQGRFIVDTATLDLAQVQDILRNGTDSVRPTGVLAYTNDWAAVYVVTAVALLSYLQQRRRLTLGWLALIGLGLLPLLESLSRAAWASLLVGLAVVVAARAARSGLRAVLPVVLAVTAGAVVVLAGPAASTIDQRLDTGHSDVGRHVRVVETVERTAERPLTGHGTPLPSRVQGGPSVGTHGHLWLVLFSQGLPGAVALVAFLVATAAFALRAGPVAEPLLAVVAVLAAQSLFYEWMAVQVVLLLGLLGATARAAARTDTRPHAHPAAAGGSR